MSTSIVLDSEDIEDEKVSIYDIYGNISQEVEVKKLKNNNWRLHFCIADRMNDNITYDTFLFRDKICKSNAIITDYIMIITITYGAYVRLRGFEKEECNLREYYRRGEKHPFRVDIDTYDYDTGYLTIYPLEGLQMVNTGDDTYMPNITIHKYFDETNIIGYCIPDYLFRFCNTGQVTLEEALKFPHDSYLVPTNSKRFLTTKSARCI